MSVCVTVNISSVCVCLCVCARELIRVRACMHV